jgi:arsenite oxidase large subunit
MSDGDQRLTRRRALGAISVAGTTLALPSFLRPTVAAAAGALDSADNAALFLGQGELPVPPRSAKRYTTACQFCNVGCGYIVYTWPVKDTPAAGAGVAEDQLPVGALGDWISPAFVTRRDIEGVDSFVAVVPDSDCVVNRGDHSPRGGTNALTVYTTREHPLTDPSERLLKPQIRSSKGDDLQDASWDDAVDLIADKVKEALDHKGPSAIGFWGADHLSPEKNYVEVKFLFAPKPVGLYDPDRGSVDGVAVRAIHNRAKWNSEHPSIAEHFGSPSTLLYSYKDFEAADTILLSGANTYETGTVLYNRMHAARNRKVVIDPRRTVPAANARDGGGVHLQLKPGTDVVLLNSLMHVIVGEGLQDQAFIDARTDRRSFAELRELVRDDRYSPESTEAVTGVSPRLVRRAARMLGRPHKTSILFEKGVIWQGTQNEAVLGSYANLALLLGSLGREGRVFGRQGGHQDAIMSGFDHPEPDALKRRNLWQELARGSIDVLFVTICNPLRMSQQAEQLRRFVQRVPFVVEVNIRPSDMTQVADVSLPSTQWGEYDYSRSNLERRVRLNRQFCDPPGEARPDYLIVAQIAKRLADRHHVLDPSEWGFRTHEQVYDELRHTDEGKGLGLDKLSRQRLVELGTNGIQVPILERGGGLVGTERLYAERFETEDGKGRFVARDQQWTDDDPLAFLPEEIKPDAEYPFFLTTVRYQAIWQSGYTYRWTKDLAQQVAYNEVTINPKDANRLGIYSADWVELRNQYGRCEGLANVSDVVPPGVVSTIFAWQGPSDEDPRGEPRFYANNLVAGGRLQQASNAAYFKNGRVAVRRLDRERLGADQVPGMTFGDRTVDGMSARGAAGNPRSQGSDSPAVPLRAAPGDAKPGPDFGGAPAGDIGRAG